MTLTWDQWQLIFRIFGEKLGMVADLDAFGPLQTLPKDLTDQIAFDLAEHGVTVDPRVLKSMTAGVRYALENDRSDLTAAPGEECAAQPKPSRPGSWTGSTRRRLLETRVIPIRLPDSSFTAPVTVRVLAAFNAAAVPIGVEIGVHVIEAWKQGDVDADKEAAYGRAILDQALKTLGIEDASRLASYYVALGERCILDSEAYAPEPGNLITLLRRALRGIDQWFIDDSNLDDLDAARGNIVQALQLIGVGVPPQFDSRDETDSDDDED